MVQKTIQLDLEHAQNIYVVLQNHTSLCYEIISSDIKNLVSEEAYEKLHDLFLKYHNANCGPFNRALKQIIEDTSN